MAQRENIDQGTLDCAGRLLPCLLSMDGGGRQNHGAWQRNQIARGIRRPFPIPCRGKGRAVRHETVGRGASEKIIVGMLGKNNGTTAQHDGDTYARKKEEARARNAKASRTERDISTGYPGPGNRYRRRKCAKSLESF